MRDNQPVSQREYALAPGQTLMSTTDVDSRISYANAAFIQVSGYEREELLGQPHNLVRHPDMPPEAFADMWATLKSGRSWTALVKNRRKDGDHYWVRANAAPVRRQGQLKGYMSVRTTPSREEVQQAEAMYARMRQGTLGAWRLHQGLLVRRGSLAFLTILKTASLATRIRMATFASTVLLTAGLLALCPTAMALQASVMAAIVMLMATLWLQSQISTPMQLVQKEAQEVASGQGGTGVALDRVDEVGMVLRSINQAALNLRSLIDDVGEQASGMQTASQEIATGNADLSARTEQAASNLEQTASAMEQISSTVKHNADSAVQATTLAATARQVASDGGDLVGQVVTVMSDITASSRRISDIIGVIDGIAFQTNILALNAAVEAARAGEQGRGFAVVAAEVRTLAQRSAAAAKEIKQLITSSADKVEDGAKLVDKAGHTMEDIVQHVRHVSELIAEISVASNEQNSGIGQVGQAVSELDRMTQQNAALVEQSAAAAESLKQQSVRLNDAISAYSH